MADECVVDRLRCSRCQAAGRLLRGWSVECIREQDCKDLGGSMPGAHANRDIALAARLQIQPRRYARELFWTRRRHYCQRPGCACADTRSEKRRQPAFRYWQDVCWMVRVAFVTTYTQSALLLLKTWLLQHCHSLSKITTLFAAPRPMDSGQ
jgi:hypothetical protein